MTSHCQPSNLVSSSLKENHAETKDKARRALLDAAEHCFFKLGYNGATLDAIAAQAGFTKGAVYWHFRNKEALFLELLAEGMKANSSDGERLLSQLSEQPHRLDAEVSNWLDHFDANNKVPLLALELDFESHHNESFAALLDHLVARQQKVVSQILARYFELTGRKPPMPLDEFAATWIAITKAVALSRQTRHSANLTSTKVIKCLLGLPTGAAEAA